MAVVDLSANDEAAPVGQGPGTGYEFRSRWKIGSLPLVHIVRGIDPATGSRPPAIGVVAIGQIAVGVVAVGQLAVGVIAVGQAALGLGWGVGQLAVGLLAAGQVALGALGAVGQVATGARPLGLIEDHGPWTALAWLLGGLAMATWLFYQLRTLGPIVGRGTGALASIASLRDGRARIAAHVISENQLRAPLSNRPCVYWHALRVGPGIRAQEKGGGSLLVADSSGTARVDLKGAAIFIRNDRYTELSAPDWSLHMETYLGRGDQLYIAGPVRMEPDVEAQGLYRGDVGPVFHGDASDPVVITTRPPAQMSAELKLGFGMAAALVAGALALLGHAAAVAAMLSVAGT
ncbi:MAG TPA: hypothetical protein VH374_00320 [Polyangia bacterium]|jgi:hypothetical protein|nr:hypothetical protein [Polyangia bacterium]